MGQTLLFMWFFLHCFASLLSTCGPKYLGDEVRKTAGYIVEWGTKIYSAKDVFSSIQSETIMQKSCRDFSSRDGVFFWFYHGRCIFINFSRNTRCLKCKAEGPKRVATDDVQMKKGDWNYPGLNDL
ncbi:hypothetical protein PVK06_028785 [Gossypium arboreum]|uniref:Uncharacterized protein n=1 Tax=Gossypium arboreum TaxID=29729 RepID=A0ABR0P4V3_GOSAR|nr:hypothetical protein PVK06_028785 [Gossypium arboreum]